MRIRSIATAAAFVAALGLALGPVALDAQGTGRATGSARSSGTGIADRIGIGGGISGYIGGGSITADGWGLTRGRSHPSGRIIRSTRGRSIGVANSPFGTIQHCAGVSVVTASSIWGASIRNCDRRVRTRHTTEFLPYPVPVYVPAPYVYYDASPVYAPGYVGGVPGFITAAPAGPPASRSRTLVFDGTRAYTLIWPPLLYGVPVPVYTAGDAVIYVEHPPAAAVPSAAAGGAGGSQPVQQTACARLTVILSGGDGWWKTVWLPALGASTVEGLRAVVDSGIADAPLVITDATGARVEVPARAAVRSVMVDRCPPAGGGD